MTINEYCKAWRKNHCIPMRAVAAVAGVSNASISEFEQGRTISGKVIVAYIVCGMEITHPNTITAYTS